jgi:hypothetical protein
VIRQNKAIPTQANSTAMPWINDHSHGFPWAAGWLKISVCCHTDPTPWLITVKTTLSRNGTQS